MDAVIGHDRSAEQDGRAAHDGHAGDGGHGGHGAHAGHDPEAFRRRFWLSLALTIPVVLSSEMVMGWFGYELSGVAWVGPVLGSFIFVWGGWPFLAGALAEVRAREGSGAVIGALALEDEVRPEARAAVDELHALGVERVVMVTGDARPVAEAVARTVGIDEVFSEVLPEDKDRAVAESSRPVGCPSPWSATA